MYKDQTSHVRKIKKLSDQQVKYIKMLLYKEYEVKYIAQYFGVSISVLHNLNSGRTYSTPSWPSEDDIPELLSQFEIDHPNFIF